MSESHAPALRLDGVAVDFGSAPGLLPVSLDVAAGERVVVLGASGAGKTTLLRAVAGLAPLRAGRVAIAARGGELRDVSTLPPERRDAVYLHQTPTPFAHLTVAENVAFPLRVRGVGGAERERRVRDALALVQMEAFATRLPHTLSGGQRHRVTLARAIVARPAVLLLDEPLGALDAKIRKQLRIELKALQEEVGITFVFVTHDQEEALSMSDRVAVMSNGRIEQVGTPAAVYEDPGTVFVADFLGVSNLMDADALDGGAGGSDSCTVAVGEFTLRAACGDTAARGPVKIVARPERVQLLTHGAQAANCLPGMVERTVYVGASLQVMVRLATGAQLQASVANIGGADVYEHGRPVSVQLPADALRVLGSEAPPPVDPGAAIPDDSADPAAPAGQPAG